MKNIDIDSYFDGFDYAKISCLDIPIAGAVGSYKYENYFYYCMFRAINENWNETFEEMNLLKNINIILKRLGYHISQINIENEENVFSTIKDYVNKSLPLIYFVKYNALPYTYDYLIDSSWIHALLISGYDENKKMIILKDTKVIDTEIHSEFASFFKGNPLLTMYYKLDYFLDIWRTNKLEINKTYINSLFVIEKNKDIVGEINAYSIILDISLNFNIKYDSLINLVINFNNVYIDIKNDNRAVWYFQKNMYGNLYAFFEGIRRCFKEYQLTIPDNINNFQSKYMQVRANILSRLYANAFKVKILSENKITEFINKLQINNIELERNVKLWCQIFINNYNKAFFNYASLAQVLCDSEYLQDNEHFAATRVVNGRKNAWLHDSWISDALKRKHWLLFDFGKPVTIKFLTIYHSPLSGYETKKYRILGSNDKNNWVILYTRNNNEQIITVDIVKENVFRYIKLLILDPNKIDFHARILEVEIWG